jgi:hypothetical protein
MNQISLPETMKPFYIKKKKKKSHFFSFDKKRFDLKIKFKILPEGQLNYKPFPDYKKVMRYFISHFYF